MLFRYKLLIIISLLIFSVIFPLYCIFYRLNVAPSVSHFAKLEIVPGDNLTKIAQKLQETKLIESAKSLILVCKIMRLETKIPAGVFTLPYGLSNFEIVRRIFFYGMNTENIVIREGWTTAKIASELSNKLGVDSASFMFAINDTNFIKLLGVEAPSLEGYLFPETYNLYLGMDPYEVARKMVAQFQRILNDSLKYRAFELGYSVNQIITLASIIQGEIIYASEAATVSGVYHNRLNRGMLLQADPTIQYIILDGPRRLHYSDLKIKSPYNTYVNKGLPPGPIGNPGLKAILAALYPKKVSYLYFVARGDGYHTFSSTAEEHLIAKRRLNLLRRRLGKVSNLSSKSPN